MTDATEPKEHPLSDGERMLNSGVECPLKKLGTVRVKELSLEQVLTLIGDLALVIDSLPTGLATGDNMAFLRVLLMKPETAESVRKIAAASTGRSADEFKEMGITDWLRLVKAFREVTDWEELRELFFEVIPKESFAGLTEAFQNRKASTPQPQSPKS